MKALISVIVPVYNAELYLADCLESLIRQTHRELEILVVDDGSTDGSATLSERFAGKDGRIRLLRKENGGVSSARNLGLDEAKGEYVAFVDADDWILPDMLETQLIQLTREGGDMILGGYLTVGEKERESWRKTCRDAKGEGERGIRPAGNRAEPSADPEDTEEACAPCLTMDAKGYVNDFLLQSSSRCWSILFRREAIGETRFPEGLSIGEDLLFMARLMPRLNRVLVTGACGYCYFINEAGAMLAGFRPSYMDQITCWELAERELAGFGEEAQEKVRLCLFQAALLVAGKLAQTEKRQTEEYGEFGKSCLYAAKKAWEQLGRRGRRKLPAGYRVKGTVFLCMPKIYLRLYQIWKRRGMP